MNKKNYINRKERHLLRTKIADTKKKIIKMKQKQSCIQKKK